MSSAAILARLEQRFRLYFEKKVVLGFHGDYFMLRLAYAMADQAGLFVETGTRMGNSLLELADAFPDKPFKSCEIDPEILPTLRRLTGSRSNVEVRAVPSPDFLHDLEGEKLFKPESLTSFFLDAHASGFVAPLKGEVEFISTRLERFAMMIDDFRVPGEDQFGCGKYEGETLNLRLIRKHMKQPKAAVIFPAYSVHTSIHDPLRGYCVIVHGIAPDKLIPQDVASFYKVIPWAEASKL